MTADYPYLNWNPSLVHSALAAKRATATIPIIFASSADSVSPFRLYCSRAQTT